LRRLFTDVEPVSAQFEPSLWQINSDLMTRARMSPSAAERASRQAPRRVVAAQRRIRAVQNWVGIPERGQIPHGLTLGIDRLAAALRITAPIRNQAPTQRIERYLAGLVIAPDHQQVLARRGVPPWRIVVQPAVAHVHAIDDGIAKRSAALDDPPTHGGATCVPARRRTCPAQRRFCLRSEADPFCWNQESIWRL
jgi:hypothetical protein